MGIKFQALLAATFLAATSLVEARKMVPDKDPLISPKPFHDEDPLISKRGGDVFHDPDVPDETPDTTSDKEDKPEKP